MTAPELDEDGYPTEATLYAIEHWDYHFIPELFEFIRAAWWPDFGETNRPWGYSQTLRPEERQIVTHGDVIGNDTDVYIRLATAGVQKVVIVSSDKAVRAENRLVR